MNGRNPLQGALIASVVAGLFGCAETNQKVAAPSGATDASVKCFGINSCKGQGACATAEHSCGKHTPCQGHGWLPVESAEECATKGGKVL